MQLSAQLIPDAISFVFFLATASYYVLLFLKAPRIRKEREFKSITVLIPAHNEERYIESCLRSVIAAHFPGDKEIIVVDDGSIDRTADIVATVGGAELIKTEHRGKSANINMIIERARGELFAIVDGDGEIHPDALVEMMKELEKENVVAASCPILAKNRKTHFVAWLHIELLYGSLMRSIMSKVNANIVTSGQFCMFRTSALKEVGGFSTATFSEDMEITVRLIRKGYRVGFAENATCWTNMPTELKWFIGQRYRWVRGNLNVFLNHHRLNSSLVDLYTLPLLLFGFFQGIIMGSISLFKIVSAYYYYACHGVFFGPEIASMFITWFSVFGLLTWSRDFFTGAIPFAAVTLCAVLAGLMTYPLYIWAILKYDEEFDIYHLVPLLFMAPFWWALMFIQIASIPTFFNKKQNNIWAKNDKSLRVAVPASIKADESGAGNAEKERALALTKS